MPEGSSMRTLLIVEDNLPLAQCLCLELEAEGFKACTAASAALLQMQELESVDLLVVDWDLPDLSGLELLRRLRKHKFNQPVLMLTGHDEIDRKVLALESGADDYMVKPFSFDELQARIQALLRRSGRGKGQAARRTYFSKLAQPAVGAGMGRDAGIGPGQKQCRNCRSPVP